MKKTALLNDRLSAAVARMGHTDTLAVCDCGMPIPPQTQRIDLALVRGVPGFIETLRAVLGELCVEHAFVALEMPGASPERHRELLDVLGDIPVTYVAHAELKDMTRACAACVRTGEATAFCNVVLRSGVAFEEKRA